MAARPSPPTEDLICPLCKDIFKDPVTLNCSHSFCKACLQTCWEERRTEECPTCGLRASEDPDGNQDLRDKCEAFLQNQTGKPATPCHMLCTLHRETLKLFCVNDEVPICVVCQTSEHHENHKLRPLEEVASKLKREIHDTLRPLKEQLEALTKEKQKNDQAVDFLKSQAECTVIQMQEEFQRLHQFLQDEEISKIAALREEEEQKSQKMKERVEKMAREISSLSDTIRAIEEQMEVDDVVFLQDYKATKTRVAQKPEHSTQHKTSDPDVLGAQIDVAKHLGNLKCNVWEKMKGIVQYTPFTLDPTTKGDDLIVSEDLTCLQYSGAAEPSSDDDNYILKCVVLGSISVFSGRHSWEVEVGDNPAWVLGVAESSSDEKGRKSGEMWGIGHRDGEYEAIRCAERNVKLNVRKGVKRVRVLLDWDKGKLSFFDPVSNASLHTFKQRFSKQLSPLFLVASGSTPLRICPMRITVTVG